MALIKEAPRGASPNTEVVGTLGIHVDLKGVRIPGYMQEISRKSRGSLLGGLPEESASSVFIWEGGIGNPRNIRGGQGHYCFTKTRENIRFDKLPSNILGLLIQH